MLRLIIVLLFVIVFLILSIPVWGVLWIVGRFSKEKRDKASYAIVKWAFSVVWHLSGVKLTLQGFENIPMNRSVLFIGNHQSIFDVVLTYSLSPHVTGFLSKETIKKVPLLSTWMKLNYCIFLTRTDPRADLKLILQAQEHIKNGISMFVFPEGTRSKNGKLNEFHEASFRLATKTGAPIVPVAITNTRDIFESHIPFIKGQHVVVTYMPPVDYASLEGDDKKYVGAYVKGLIEEQLRKDALLL